MYTRNRFSAMKLDIEQWYRRHMPTMVGRNQTTAAVLMSLLTVGDRRTAALNTTINDNDYTREIEPITIYAANCYDIDQWQGMLVVEYCGYYHSIQYISPNKLFMDLVEIITHTKSLFAQKRYA